MKYYNHELGVHSVIGFFCIAPAQNCSMVQQMKIYCMSDVAISSSIVFQLQSSSLVFCALNFIRIFLPDTAVCNHLS